MFGFVWERIKDGLFLPSGTQQSVSTKLARTYLDVKDNVRALQALYEKHGVLIPQNSSLANFLGHGIRMSDEWLLGGGSNLSSVDIFRGAVCSRIAESALALAEVQEAVAKHYLEKLLCGSLDLLDRTDSEAKNFLWELELLSMLRAHGKVATLSEPDILAESTTGSLGFACKKLYSENNVEKVLSKGVEQIKDSQFPGLLAINLDEWAPSQAILRVRNFAELSTICDQSNDRFLSRHRRHIEKYCCAGRALGILVSTAVVADMTEEKVRVSNARQSLFWSSTAMERDKQDIVRGFFSNFRATPEHR